MREASEGIGDPPVLLREGQHRGVYLRMVPDPVGGHPARRIQMCDRLLPVAVQQPRLGLADVMVSDPFRPARIDHPHLLGPAYRLRAVIVLDRYRTPVHVDVQPARVDVVVRPGRRIEAARQGSRLGDVLVTPVPVTRSGRQDTAS